MTRTRRGRRTATLTARLLSLVVLGSGCAGASLADPAAVIDSQSIVRSLAAPPPPATRGLVVAPRTSAGSSGAGGSVSGPSAGERKVTLDIRFANDSDRLTNAAHAQLAQLGAALNSPELIHSRFLIAGHTSATGSPEHNRRLSEARARAVRTYLLGHFSIPPERIEATGFGSSRPLPDFPPNALQQRRVEISTLLPTS
jgi:OmpA-OmpF porin, OOP family